MAELLGTMERNVGGLLVYKRQSFYAVIDGRVCPWEFWGTLPHTFNVWQNIGQFKIFFLACGSD